MEADRVDVFQPITGFAFMGRVAGLLGPPQTDLAPFIQTLMAM
jgi:hypothetical protein